ncbi:MAG: hypothetical protein Q8Q36_02485 [bacterium]|nr:hypothetical protein [bacterium]
MLYFFYGEREARQKKIEEWKEKLLKKEADASLRSLGEEEWNGPALEEFAAGRGLFGGTYVFFVKEFLATTEDREFFMDMAKTLAHSHNSFVVSEPSATKELLAAIEKAGGEAVRVAGKEPVGKRDTTGFALADAAARRDRGRSWALFQEALWKGASAEELHGILFWQMKNLFLAKKGGGGQKFSFPLMKAKAAAPKWEEQELESALSRLVSIYHEAHRGRYELPVALELFLLDVV